MPEEIKSLIEKIQKEGIQKASDEALKIVEEAKREAKKILQDAHAKAEVLLAQAKEEILKKKESSDILLKQSGRDFIISLRNQINIILKNIIAQKVSEALSIEEVSKIISLIIKESAVRGGIELAFSENDLLKIKESLLSCLSEEVKKGITIKSSEALSKGFTISFDSGKSYFDFSEQALSEYLSSYFNKELSDILDLK
ncbi:MAG: hypothetical protein WAQ07_06165 [Candidatus Omnitrophota bacterium]